MFKNYLTTALRFLNRNKAFAGINILGLSLALAVSFTCLLFVINEMSFNSSFKNGKQIYRVLEYYLQLNLTSDETPYVLSTSMKDDFPMVIHVAPTKRMGEFGIEMNEELIPLNHTISTNSDLFKIFDIQLSGQQEGILDEPNSMLLSRTQSQKFFPAENPIGKEVIAQVGDQEVLFVVKGIFDDIPINSSVYADCFINARWALDKLDQRFEDENSETDWYRSSWQTWVLMDKDADETALDKLFRDLEKKVFGSDDRYDYSMQSLSDVYLGSQDISSDLQKGDMKNIHLFLAIAILIILVAAFNYIILSTAVSTNRAKEIGIRKTIGADFSTIRRQLLYESVILTISALPVALVFAWMGRPVVEELFQTELLLIKSNFAMYILVYFALVIAIGLASGLYTSSYLSKQNVIRILNNTMQAGKGRSRVRFALIVIQLVIFCVFVSSTLIVRSQYNYALNEDPGYYNEDILFVDLKGVQNPTTFINNIKAYPSVISAGGSVNPLPMQNSWPYSIPYPHDDSRKVYIELMAVDFDFIETMGLQVIEGRGFSREFGSDGGNSCLLNESAVEALELDEPVGQQIGVDSATVIGVVKDFNLHSFHNEIPPLYIVAADHYAYQVAIHYETGSLNTLLPQIKEEWNRFAPDQALNIRMIDELTKEIYGKERSLSIIISLCALFSLIIASLGLFGLMLFIVKQQTKTIGIKRVFGSSEKSIVLSYVRSNFVIVVLATILSIPPTIIIMNRWLNNYPFRTDIHWWVFAFAFIIALVMVLLTVLYNSFKASRINPVEALRYE
jgi:putative ABC transport system permease protein